jgi:lipid II:glycine glycyltransferase (peptidoglycan interpeptide bridge formation enzyme)
MKAMTDHDGISAQIQGLTDSLTEFKADIKESISKLFDTANENRTSIASIQTMLAERKDADEATLERCEKSQELNEHRFSCHDSRINRLEIGFFSLVAGLLGLGIKVVWFG